MSEIMVVIERIVFNPNNPRKFIDEVKLQELADSIREHGIVEPLVVVPFGENYMLVAGERRLRAAKIVGLSEVPVVVKDYSPAVQKEIMLIENLQREDLDPIEEATAYRQLIDDYEHTQEALAGRIGVSQSQIANRLRLLELPEDVQGNITRGILTAGHGKVLAGYVKQLPAEIIQTAAKVYIEESVPVAKAKAKIQVFIARAGLPLSEKSWNGPAFETADCQNCQSRLKGRYQEFHSEEPFCINKPCWEEKQKAAKAQKEKEENERNKAQSNSSKELQKKQVEITKKENAAKKVEIKEKIKETVSQVKAANVDIENPAILKLVAEVQSLWDKLYHSYETDVTMDRESIISLEGLLKYWKTKDQICKEATSMPAQMGWSDVHIPEQEICFKGSESKETFKIKDGALMIHNNVGYVRDKLPLLPVYYRIRSTQYAGSKEISQMVGIITPNRTIIVMGNSTATIRKDIFANWIELVNQLPGIPGKEDQGQGQAQDNGLAEVGEDSQAEQNPSRPQEQEEGKGYITEDGRELFVYEISPGVWGTFWRSDNKSLHRIVTPAMPNVATREEAQENLDQWANKKGYSLIKKCA